MDELTSRVTSLTFPLVQLHARNIISRRVMEHARIDVVVDLQSRDLVMSLSALLAGQEGQTVSQHFGYTEPKFPRWIPRWLRHRWSTPRVASLDATPLLAWPEAQWAPDAWGGPIRIARYDGFRQWDDE